MKRFQWRLDCDNLAQLLLRIYSNFIAKTPRNPISNKPAEVAEVRINYQMLQTSDERNLWRNSLQNLLTISRCQSKPVTTLWKIRKIYSSIPNVFECRELRVLLFRPDCNLLSTSSEFSRKIPEFRVGDTFSGLSAGVIPPCSPPYSTSSMAGIRQWITAVGGSVCLRTK